MCLGGFAALSLFVVYWSMKRFIRKVLRIICIGMADVKAIKALTNAIKAQDGNNLPDAVCNVEPEVLNLFREIGNDFPPGSKGRAVFDKLEEVVEKGFRTIC